jgi:hypothetical protein
VREDNLAPPIPRTAKFDVGREQAEGYPAPDGSEIFLPVNAEKIVLGQQLFTER